MIESHRASGRFGMNTLLFAVLGMAIVIAASYVYQLAIYWIPLIYVNFLLTIGFGILAGIVSSVIVKYGHCRNVGIGLLVGAMIAIAGIGGKFVFQYLQGRSELSEFLAAGELVIEGPDGADLPADAKMMLMESYDFARHIQIRMEEGWELGRRGNGGLPIKGPFVALVWLIEAGIVGWYAVSSAKEAASAPYNEQLERWADEEEIIGLIPVAENDILALSQVNSIDQLLSPPPTFSESNQFLQYTISSIDGQEMENAYLSLDRIAITTNKKGESEKDEKSLFKYVLLNSDQRKALTERLSQATSALETDLETATENDALQESSDEPTA